MPVARRIRRITTGFPPVAGGGGSVANGDSFTVTGTGFGSKSTAAPIVWDNCAHGQALSARWDDYAPTLQGGGNDLAYRTSGYRGVTAPTAHGGFLAGCHLNDGGAFDGWNVMVAKTVPWSEGALFYVSWYDRADPAWSLTSTNDNYKTFAMSQGPGIYDLPYWYLELKPGMYTGADVYEKRNDFGTDNNGMTDSAEYAHTPIPISNWNKRELLMKIVWSTTDGYVYEIVNNAAYTGFGGSATSTLAGFPSTKLNSIPKGKLSFFTEGRTLAGAPTGGNQSIQIGGFMRDNDSNAFRYYSDLYVDSGFSRLMLANNSDYDSATIVEPQPCTAWSGTSITANLNKGALSSGTAYAFVFDASNNRISAGTVSIA